MKTLLVLRHAKSSWKRYDLADHDRPLKKRGKRDAPMMGRLLSEEGLLPDLILCSTAKRSRQTADLVIESSDYEGEIEFSRDLYHTDPDDIIRVLRDVPEEYDRVMVIGHNPGLEELLELITGEWEKLPTAALAHMRLSVSNWNELDEDTQGDLVSLWRPKEIR